MLPFASLPSTAGFSQQNVIPMIPALTLIITPLLSAFGTRLVLLVGLTQLLKSISSSIFEIGAEFKQSSETSESWNRTGPDLSKIKLPTSIIEALVAIFLVWTAFNMFFTSYIDYNTKFLIGGVFLAGISFAIFSYLDSSKTKRIFKKKVSMTLFSWNGEIDTVLSPRDSIWYNKYFLHSGMMSMDPKTGFVKAYVGGINYRHFKYDHVVVGKRQVG